MNYELNKEYFKVVNEYIDKTINWKAAIICAVIGCIVLSFGGAGILFGLGLIAIGVIIVVTKKSKISSEEARIQAEKDKIPSDAQYDTEVAKELVNLKTRALNKLGLDEDEVKEIEPISFDNYSYKGANNVKLGKDNLWRTDKYEAVMLFFSANEVHCYKYNFNTLENRHTEDTDVYFYKDVVSVSTSSESVKLKDHDIDYEAFKLTTAGGTSVSVSLRDVDNAQRSINAMRSLVKAKKMG